MSQLEVQDLTADYGRQPVLRDVSFGLDSGRSLSVLGPSGCGKTTLLLCLAGLHDPAAGRILLDGADVTSVPAERRGVVLLHQENTLFPHMSVAKNVAFGLTVRGKRGESARRRVEELLSLVNLQGYEGRRVDALSGGEKQRVMLARALAVEPKVLLLDEPLSSLDRSLRVRLREELRSMLNELGVTTLFVTHDQEEAAWMGDDILLLDAGSIVDRGTAQRLRRRPANPAAARLMGHRNLVPFRQTADGIQLEGLGTLRGRPESPASGWALLPEELLRIDDADAAGWPARVLEARHVGTHWFVRLTAGDHDLVALLADSAQPPVAGPARVNIDPSHVHLMAA